MRAGLLLALLLLLALPAGAGAGTVRVDFYAGSQDCSKYSACPPDTVDFTAAPGETNDVTVTSEYSGTSVTPRFVLRDAGAPLEVGAGCDRIDERAARCGADTVGTVGLGDGDDRTTSDAGTVLGGAGDDTLSVLGGEGGPGNDVLICVPQAFICSLAGGPGLDRLTGGASEDFIDGGAGGSDDDDVLDGGGGFDVLLYTSHRGPVEVDLAGPPQRFASPGEQDSIANFETVNGGPGDDVLSTAAGLVLPSITRQIRGGKGNDRILLRSGLSAYGDAGDDQISGPSAQGSYGGEGDDRLTGAAGRDLLSGDQGLDVLVGLGGRDELRGGPGPDALTGGRGNDRLVGGGGKDVLGGGAGADTLESREDRSVGERRARDRVNCGAGRRDRAIADRRDRVKRCERVSRPKRRRR